MPGESTYTNFFGIYENPMDVPLDHGVVNAILEESNAEISDLLATPQPTIAVGVEAGPRHVLHYGWHESNLHTSYFDWALTQRWYIHPSPINNVITTKRDDPIHWMEELISGFKKKSA